MDSHWTDNSTDYKDGTFIVDMDFRTPLGLFHVYCDTVSEPENGLSVTFYRRDFTLNIFQGQVTNYTTAKAVGSNKIANYLKNLARYATFIK